MSIVIRNVAAAAALVAVSLPGFAQTAASPSTTRSVADEWRWPYEARFWNYIGASVGRSDFNDIDCFAGTACDRTDTGFKLFAGGKLYNAFGLEVGYVNLGRADVAGGRARAQGANISLVAGLPIGDRFGINGKIGTTYGWTRTSTTIPGYDSGHDRGFGLSYGVGGTFAITRNTELRLDWDRYRFDFRGPGHQDVDLLSAGVNFRF